MTPTKWAKRLLLAGVAAQATVITGLVVADKLRCRRTDVSFPRSRVRPVSVGAGEVTPYTYGEDLYADMLATIRGAGRQILFETFIWKGDRVGQEFKEALIEAADRGVDVYVIYDGFANLVVPRRFQQFPPTMRVLRYPVFAPGWRIFDPRRYGRDHRKILVVDGEVGFVGGFNIGALYAARWRDTHARITGPSVWDLENAFIDLWNLRRDPGSPTLDSDRHAGWEPRIRVHRNAPRRLVFPIRNMYLEAFDRASRRITLTHAYFIPDRDILNGLLAAAERGVDVRLLVPAASNHVVADWLSRGLYSTLLRGGVRIFLYRDAMIHAKTATVDGRWSTIGTANIDRLSLTGNYEVNVEFYHDGVATQLEQIFRTDCTNADELVLAEWSSRPLVAKIGEAVLAPLRPLL
jgi:cardiolipin synthase